VCDTLCLLRPKGTLFAKNSDRPVAERQVLNAYPARRGGGKLETQYLTIEDTGALPTVLSQPDWLWGAEQGVNACHVAIGNEKIYGIADPYEAPAALIGMDLVRLGLERGRSAQEAVEVITNLLKIHGQGGVGDASNDEPYWSSFIVSDPTSSWILETCARTWVAHRVESSAAISNRITLKSDWERSSDDVAAGADFDKWRNPDAPTGHADVRLEASNAFLAEAERDPDATGPRDAVGHLRDHGYGPWGKPGIPGEIYEPPQEVSADGTGVSMCMHVKRFMATTASIVAELALDPQTAARAWAGIENPCISIFIPLIVPALPYEDAAPIAPVLSDMGVARRFATLRRQVESKPGALERVRAGLGELEGDLWEEAAALSDDVAVWERFGASASERVISALDALAAEGIGKVVA
jgi:secernin